ncbi:MAG: VPLPA-CTERM sorting domain-containing protein [Gammaproteobacteria bacterium]|nr:VPLPA-CTERM sorting domain-containing protein [Gammaproteobacteria bacterium]
MDIKSNNILFVGLASLVMSWPSQAGMIYTDETSFDSAVASLSLLWQEDFGGFPQGGVANPLSIAGGQAEVSGFGVTSVLFPATSEWIGTTGGSTSIQGTGGTSLGLAAISFNFGTYETAGQQVIFNLVGGGSDISLGYAITSFFPDGAANFAGWIGGPGEQLMDVTFSLQKSVILDNINGYVPIPSAVWLFGSGLIGLIGIARRKKA